MVDTNVKIPELTREELKELVLRAHKLYSDGFQKVCDLACKAGDENLARAIVGMGETLGLIVKKSAQVKFIIDVDVAKDSIVDYLDRYGSKNMTEISAAIKINYHQTIKLVDYLIKDKRIIRTGSGKGTRYDISFRRHNVSDEAVLLG